MHNQAVEHNVAAFSELSFAIHRQRMLECYPEASATSNSNESNIKLLTTAAMVDNLAEKVDECPLNGIVKYCSLTVGTVKAVRYTE